MLKWIIRIIIILLILFAAIWLGAPWLLSLSVADYEGDIAVAGLGNPVEITFDAKGIPQVWADTDADMYYALGWLHASERLFQMELVRRMAAGELSRGIHPRRVRKAATAGRLGPRLSTRTSAAT